MYQFQFSKRWMRATAKVQTGSVLVEFKLIASVVLLLFPLTLQLGLVYHAKLVLNYAVFEAARKGAVNNAQVSAMRDELGIRLAPLHGGDGSAEAALVAVAQSTLATLDFTSTQIAILNPTPAAFDDWGVLDADSNRRVIPNAHLRHQPDSVGPQSGVNLQDANLLKVQVTHGVQLRVPFAGSLIARAMVMLDPTNISFYARRKFPVTSVATVRMQSVAWESEILNAASAGSNPSDSPLRPAESDQPGILAAGSSESSQATDSATDEADAMPTSVSVADADSAPTPQSDTVGSEQSGGAWGSIDDCVVTEAARSGKPILVSTADYLDYLHGGLQ